MVEKGGVGGGISFQWTWDKNLRGTKFLNA